jgi:ferredoxin-NADP reductase
MALSATEVVVQQTRLEARGIISVELRPVDRALKLPGAAAGAHIDLQLAPGLTRSYSLIRLQQEDVYTIAVLRDSAGRGGSLHVHDKLEVGDLLTVSLPRNHFELDETAPMSVLLAGGIGITPLYAMLERLAQLGKEAHLIYCARSRLDAAFIDDINVLLGDHPELSAYFYWNDEHGSPPDLSVLLSGFPPDTHFYCCGPAPMLDAYEAKCKDLRYTHVHAERFSPIELQDTQDEIPTSYTVKLKKSGKSIEVAGNASLLDALLEAGCDLEYSCREGTCGSCETKVISGDVEHRDAILSSEERAANKTMMVCVSRSRSANLELDI